MKILSSLILSFVLIGLWSCTDAGNSVNCDCTGGLELDCAGECGGDAIVDVCGDCEGSGLNSDDCCGTSSSCVHYSTDIQPIFNNNCILCHTSSHPSGLDLSTNASYTSLISNNVIVSGDHTNSKIWDYISTGYMPMNADDLNTDNVNLIAQWIDEGALDN